MILAASSWSCSNENDPIECDQVEIDTQGSYLKLLINSTSGGATGNLVYQLAFKDKKMASEQPVLNFLAEKTGVTASSHFVEIYIQNDVDSIDLYMKNALPYNFTAWFQTNSGEITKRFYLVDYNDIKQGKEYVTLATSTCEAKKPFN